MRSGEPNRRMMSSAFMVTARGLKSKREVSVVSRVMKKGLLPPAPPHPKKKIESGGHPQTPVPSTPLRSPRTGSGAPPSVLPVFSAPCQWSVVSGRQKRTESCHPEERRISAARNAGTRRDRPAVCYPVPQNVPRHLHQAACALAPGTRTRSDGVNHR